MRNYSPPPPPIVSLVYRNHERRSIPLYSSTQLLLGSSRTILGMLRDAPKTDVEKTFSVFIQTITTTSTHQVLFCSFGLGQIPKFFSLFFSVICTISQGNNLNMKYKLPDCKPDLQCTKCSTKTNSPAEDGYLATRLTEKQSAQVQLFLNKKFEDLVPVP